MYQVHYVERSGIFTILGFKSLEKAKKFKEELFYEYLIPADIFKDGVLVSA